MKKLIVLFLFISSISYSQYNFQYINVNDSLELKQIGTLNRVFLFSATKGIEFPDGSILPSANIILSDAPNDGMTYSRRNENWVEIKTDSSWYSVNSTITKTDTLIVGVDTITGLLSLSDTTTYLGSKHKQDSIISALPNKVNFTDTTGVSKTISTKYDGDTTYSVMLDSVSNLRENSPIDNIFKWNTNYYYPYPSFQANSFYSGTTSPSGTTRLNYDGDLYVSKLNGNAGTFDTINWSTTKTFNSVFTDANGDLKLESNLSGDTDYIILGRTGSDGISMFSDGGIDIVAVSMTVDVADLYTVNSQNINLYANLGVVDIKSNSNSYVYDSDTLRADGSGTSTANNIKAKTVSVTDSIFINNAWINTAGGFGGGDVSFSDTATGSGKLILTKYDGDTLQQSIDSLESDLADTGYGLAEADSGTTYISVYTYNQMVSDYNDSLADLRSIVGDTSYSSKYVIENTEIDSLSFTNGTVLKSKPTDLMSGLQGSYSMYTLLGDSCIDNSGNYNNLFAYNVVKDSVGRLGKAFYFTAADTSYLGNVDLYDYQDITISAWFKTYSNAQQSIVSNRAFTTDYTGYTIFVDNEFTYQGEITVWLFIAGARQTIHTGVLVDDGNWHNVIVTSTSGNQYVYIDGRQVAAAATAGAIDYTSSNFRISGEDDWSFIGLIDEVDIYNRVLTDSERNNLIRLR